MDTPPAKVLTTDAARATMGWAGTIILLSVAVIAIGAISGWMLHLPGAFNPVPFVPIILFAIFTSRGYSVARILLMVLVGIQVYNLFTSGALAQPGLLKLVVPAYLLAVVVCLVNLFREPAAAHFRR